MDADFDFRKEMTLGLKWYSLSHFFGYAVQFIVWAVLARILPPASFGALSIALAFANLMLLVNELGFTTAIIQKKDLSENHNIVTFWVCAFIGVSFLLLAVLASRPLAYFFKNTELAQLVIIFSMKFLVDFLGQVQVALLMRELSFKALTFIEIPANLIFGITAITLASRGGGIDSMAWGYLAGSLVKLILLWHKHPFRPRPVFDMASFKELFHFGKNIVGYRLMSYFSGNIDIFLIGKFLGSTALGYYSLALNLANLPRQKISYVISNVAFPAFAKIQDNAVRLDEVYLKVIRYLAVVNFPLLIGLAFLAPQFVHIIYTAKWNAMIFPLQVLCFYGICFSITTFIGVVFNAVGKPEYSLKFSLIAFAGAVIAVLSGIKCGLFGIAIALSIYAFIMNLIGHLIVRRITKTTFTAYFKAMSPAAVSSLAMSLWLICLIWLENNVFLFGELRFFILCIITSMFIYGLALFLAYRRTFQEMTGILRQMF